MDKPIIIIGAGVAGLSVAEILAGNGLECVIVERSTSIGGHVRGWSCMANDHCTKCLCCSVDNLAAEATASEKIEVLTGWEVKSIFDGSNEKRVHLMELCSGRERVEDGSAVVIAAGFKPYDPQEKVLLGHGRLNGVYSLAEINSLVRSDNLSQFADVGKSLKVAFFQCVGSREANSEANYCSQHCCKSALRMALKLVHERPEMEVTVFYIDLQVSGKFAGTLLKEAADKGVNLRQGVPGEITDHDGGLEVIVEWQGLNRKERFDRVILSTGQRPNPVHSIIEQIRLSTDNFGFIRSKNPLDSSRTEVEGVYLAGTCCGPKDIEATLEHAGQTAQAIMADLRKGKVR